MYARRTLGIEFETTVKTVHTSPTIIQNCRAFVFVVDFISKTGEISNLNPLLFTESRLNRNGVRIERATSCGRKAGGPPSVHAATVASISIRSDFVYIP